jgi:hypothetical protein
MQSIDHPRFEAGQKVIAGNGEEIGEVLGLVSPAAMPHLHVKRYGIGEDEIYVPTIAVSQVIGQRVYLSLNALDLVAEAWHELPASSGPGPQDSDEPDEMEIK